MLVFGYLSQIIKRARQRHLLAQYTQQNHSLHQVVTDAVEAATVNVFFSLHWLSHCCVFFIEIVTC